MLEVNAAYSNQPINHPIVICPSDLGGGHPEGFDLVGTLVALEVDITPVPIGIWVEQVAWTQAPHLAAVWCEQNSASDWLALTSGELARGLETHPDFVAYIAYEADAAVGMMIASSDGFCGLWAGADDVARALFARGANDLKRLAVNVPLERRRAFAINAETASFDIWLSRSQPSDAQAQPLSDP